MSSASKIANWPEDLHSGKDVESIQTNKPQKNQKRVTISLRWLRLRVVRSHKTGPGLHQTCRKGRRERARERERERERGREYIYVYIYIFIYSQVYIAQEVDDLKKNNESFS
jgi:hypothetical protein